MSTTMYALTPMFRLKTVDVSDTPWHDPRFIVTLKGKLVPRDKLFTTPNDAYKSGINQVSRQRADLERRSADIDARCVNLETIRAGLRV